MLGKISKLEEQISKPISDDLYEEIKVLKEKNKNYAVLKGIFTDICQALLIDEDQSDKICGKIKEIENKGNIYLRSYNICEQLVREFGLNNQEEIFDNKKNIISDNKVVYKLYEKLADLLVQCSPKGKFTGLPSCHHVWKWITRILEDYMMLKKENNKNKSEAKD